jgi:hypothetical protein
LVFFRYYTDLELKRTKNCLEALFCLFPSYYGGIKDSGTCSSPPELFLHVWWCTLYLHVPKMPPQNARKLRLQIVLAVRVRGVPARIRDRRGRYSSFIDPTQQEGAVWSHTDII